MPIAIATGCQIGQCCNYSGIVNYHNRIYCLVPKWILVVQVCATNALTWECQVNWDIN